jgi:hypothetical protein
MKPIALATLVVLGGLLLTACPGDPECALSEGFSLSSDKTTVTTDGAVVTLTAQICSRLSTSPVEFYDATKIVGTLPKPNGSQTSDGNGSTFDAYSYPVSLTKTQNGSHVYTAKITLRDYVLTTNEVTVTVNIP